MEDVLPVSGLYPLVPSPDRATHRTMHLGTRQVPKIDGSQGAFIGLVVALSVLIVVCCAAVFYLLRHHEPTDQDRAARRERYRRTRENTSSSFTGPSTSTIGLGSLGDKVKHLWQRTGAGGGGAGEGRGRRGGRGWIRAGSDDEWASHSDHEGGVGVDPELGGRLRSLPVLRQDTRDGAEGVRIVESPSSDTTGGLVPAPYAYAYTDPFPKTASHGTLQRPRSPLSSPASSPRECTSVDGSPEVHSPDDDHRHRSTMSNSSVWTHAGSKFVEDI